MLGTLLEDNQQVTFSMTFFMTFSWRSLWHSSCLSGTSTTVRQSYLFQHQHHRRRCGYTIIIIMNNETKMARYSLTLYVNTRVSPLFLLKAINKVTWCVHRYKSYYKPNIDIASGDQDLMAITMKCSFEKDKIRDET